MCQTTCSRPRAMRAVAARLASLLVCTGGVVALGPATATASVQIDPQRVVVTAPGARATVMRAPFRISIDDGAGVAALAEVPNTGALPTVLLPSVYPAPLGAKPLPQNDLYSPLTFLVGTAITTQWGGGPLFFQGNQQTGLVTGIEYSARDVISAQQVGNGAQLVLSTNDPSGRRLIVTVAPTGSGMIRVVASPSPSDGVALVSDSFASNASEQFHGFGGRHNAIDQHGNDFYSWIEEENSSGLPGAQAIQDAVAGQPNYMFPNGPGAAYTAHALFYSSHPYGFMLDQPNFARWRMDSDRSDAWRVDVYGDTLNYIVAPGSAPHAITAITSITGRERIPPAWAIAPEIDRAVRASSPESASEVQAEVQSDISNIDRYRLPVGSFRIEGSPQLTPTVLASLYAQLRARRIHPLAYFRAFVASPTGGTEDASAYDYAISHHYVATNADGSPATFGSAFQNGTAALIDFSNPAAVSWWQGRIRAALDAGADGFMQDFGEQIDTAWHFYDGETGATMHNRYPILYDRATRQVIDAYERQHHGRQIFFFTRAGYSGDPGSAAYENAEFLGDSTTSWDHASGIASVIPDMLNRGVGGAYGPTTDIGGYLNLLTPPTSKELLLRWAELAALTPFYWLHNSGYTGTEMPWSFDSQTVAIYKHYAELHIAAEPLILNLWRRADRTGIPIMRPLWLDYPGDATAAAQDEEWLLGPDVLVAPVTGQGASSRSVYFPQGCWQDPHTGQAHQGPSSTTVSAPLDTLPYYFRCGTQPFKANARAAPPKRRATHRPSRRRHIRSSKTR